jgi:predicted O-methyltransferase YrrM
VAEITDAFQREISDRYPGTQFTVDYISFKSKILREQLGDLSDKPDARYLEVGAFEGLSMIWFLKELLPLPSQKGELIDLFYDRETAYMEKNLELAGVRERCRVHRGASEDVLKTLDKESYDVIQIDGSHLTVDVLQDLVLAWPLLKVGGRIVIDDYQLGVGVHSVPEEDPAAAIDAFLRCFRSELEIVYSGYYIIARRLPRHPWQRQKV